MILGGKRSGIKIGRFSKKIKKVLNKEATIENIAYGFSESCLSKIDLQYKKYVWTEEFVFDETLEVAESNYIYVATQYYDVFQRLLSTLRAESIKFFLMPIEVYKEINPCIAKYQSDYDVNLEACTFNLDERGESWGICIPKFIRTINDLFKVGHEIAHLVLKNLPENVEGSNYQKINWKSEYDADVWSYTALNVLGYLTDEQKLKLIDISQLEYLMHVKQITAEDHKKLLNKDFFDSFKRSKENGTLAENICRLISKGITSSNTVKQLTENIRGNV